MRAIRPLLVLLIAAVALAQPEPEAAQPTEDPAAALIQPKAGVTHAVDPIAVVKQAGGQPATTFDLVAGTSLALDGSDSTWTAGWQYFRWEFQGCNPPLETNWGTLEATRFVSTFLAGTPTSSKAVTFNTKGLKSTAVCRVNFVVIDNYMKENSTAELTINVQPGAPSCNVILPSVSNVKAVPVGTVCTGKKSMRSTGKLPKGATQLKVSQHSIFAITDPQGFKASSIVLTQAEIDTPAPACACKPKGIDQCQCVPDAKLLEGSDTAYIMPQKAVTGGTTVRVHYKATVAETGLSCEGFTDVCFAKARTQCAAFGAKGAPPRDALTC